MTCKDCYHEFVCSLNRDLTRKAICACFKDKSRIVKLPCKIGDTVYVITEKHPCYACKCCGDFCHKDCHIKDKQKLVVKEAKVFYFLFQERSNEIQVEVEGTKHLVMHFLHFTIEDFGKTVFLTREEAEKALRKEREK